jgi:single-strand DNA-binding protein
LWYGIAWPKSATQYLTKGKLVYIEGAAFKTREWDDQDGNKRRTTEVRAREMVMLGGNPGENVGGGQRRAASAEGSVGGGGSTMNT